MTVELVPHGMAHGGEAVARHEGRACFVAGAMPGERVVAEAEVEKASWARYRLLEVVEPSPRRVAPPCPHFSDCGGCTWQHADYTEQLVWKREIVAGQLAHLGRVADPQVAPTVAPGPPYHYRNRIDFVVADGKPAMHRARSKELVPLDICLLPVPAIAELISRLGDLSGVERITLRAGVRTGDLLVVVKGRVPDHVADWGAPVVVTGTGGPRPARRHLREEVAGVRFQVTGSGFFQVNTPGADHLVRLVTEALRPAGDDVLLDAYAGVGLFSATVGSHVAAVVAVERGRSAVRDLERNLRRAGMSGEIVEGSVARDLPSSLAEAAVTPWTLAVCDPPRSGLGPDGVTAIVATRPRRLAYVSCDPASLARDTRLLADAGYRLELATPVDLFPQTYHIETVAAFSRDGR